MNRQLTTIVLFGFSAFAAASLSYSQVPPTYVNKLGIEQDVRSGMRIAMDDIRAGSIVLPDDSNPVTILPPAPQIQLRGDNVQASATTGPTADYVQQFTGFRPFVHGTQSEVSTAASGKNIVVGYNNSAGLHLIQNPQGPGLIVDSVQLSGFSWSNDGGKTWSSGSLPGSAGTTDTFGDPSVGVDRHGVFYYATLAADAHGIGTVQVNTSNDGGATWSAGAIVQQDDASDKEWLAVGPDPAFRNRDNVYVTWTSFQNAACELRFGRSTDGGATWTAKTIYIPTANANPRFPQNCLTFSNPTVDANTGTLYVPFLRFSNANQDFIQMLVSKDAGDTFQFATFNVPGAPDSTVYPVTQPGEYTSCGGTRVGNTISANIRLTIHGLSRSTPGLFGLPRYINASRMTLQPSAAAFNGSVYLAWNNSRSLNYGSSAGSDIQFLRSDDGGQTWLPAVQVNPASDLHHVLPSLAIDPSGVGVHVSYYTQHDDRTIDLDMANSLDRGNTFPADRTVRVTSNSSSLPPTNIPLSNAPVFSATNFDRQISVCYALGEYQGATTANGTVYAGWGDARNLFTEPLNALSPISGQTHSQPDVFVQVVKAQ